jgi:DNA polymerase-3 subunit epsilon
MTELLEEYAAALEQSGRFRILRRLEPRTEFSPEDGPTKIGIVLDTEGTGTDPAVDQVTQLAMVRFSYGPTGDVHRVLGIFDKLREPKGVDISPEITRLTGISPEMVTGRHIDSSEVEAFVKDASVILAHNCSYDRRMVEPLFPIFKKLCWACSYKEISWSDEGYGSARLGDLLAGLGLYHDGHNAHEDCLALLECLSRKLPVSGRSALGTLLEHARAPTYLVTVENTRNAGPALKKRGFHWHDGLGEHPSSWRLETTQRRAQLEASLIAEDYPAANITVRRITAFDRFSNRA